MLASTKLLRGPLLDKEILLAIDRGLQQSEDIADDELGDLGEWILQSQKSRPPLA